MARGPFACDVNACPVGWSYKGASLDSGDANMIGHCGCIRTALSEDNLYMEASWRRSRHCNCSDNATCRVKTKKLFRKKRKIMRERKELKFKKNYIYI